MALERQADNAIKFYDSRSYNYDDSWHADFTQRFASSIPIQPGQQVLDLACGTGLLTFFEADAVGPTGHVIGIDVTPSMLAIAAFKKRKEAEKYANVDFHEGDVLHLEQIEALKGKTFDMISVASALVLFPDPQAAIEHWLGFLKPGGIIALDSTHPRNLVSGMVLERTARRLDLPMPYNREWSQSEASLKEVLESAGVQVESVVTIENQAGYGRRFHGVEEWDDHFVENVIVKDVARTFASNDIRRKAQGIFKEEWERLAVDGKVEEVDSVFFAIARKPADGSRYVPRSQDNGIVFKGGCRCGAIKYTCTEPPSDITLCHCRACQQVSGSIFLPFIEVPTSAFQFTSSITLKTLKLSDIADRTLCTSCGTPITMVYKSAPHETSLTWGSVDLGSLRVVAPKVRQHIFLKEKASWVVLPDNGAERYDEFPRKRSETIDAAS
ncbi:S-adenosyl-L-methionine-dependent methyltransferase [Lentithecium fluviatile CBS 122367]|uniref:S-adenosyl-L-methionine-dependent methyltransferase n=1 Tax=Lentithecium fluviatile CBS 122367 TaxID=1168545 RepID=A0A6G1IFH6_9PLEO|nr:S-adenosyl-L-methionine-dependent methyltransferase [Lentithecium fluviatile CBS 122367]